MKKVLALMTPILMVACAFNSNKIENQVSTIGKPGDVEITNLTKTKDIVSGNMIVRWNFVTSADKPEQVFWRCEFVDANGFSVGEAARYVEATIYPNQPTSETCTYPSQQATDFKISFQNIATNMTVYH
jgi:hypothetical protein